MNASFDSASVRQRYCIDASVAVRFYFSTELQEKAERIYAALIKQDMDFVAPSLILPEVSNAFRNNIRFHKFPLTVVREAFGDFLALPKLLIDPLVILEAAFDLSCAHDISVYDAMYVAACRLLSIPFVTADKKLIGKIPADQAKLIWLGDFEAAGA